MDLCTVESSAPGKVILFGEHAVVYGGEAIAASLSDLRVCVKVVSFVLYTSAHVDRLPYYVDSPGYLQHDCHSFERFRRADSCRME